MRDMGRAMILYVGERLMFKRWHRTSYADRAAIVDTAANGLRGAGNGSRGDQND